VIYKLVQGKDVFELNPGLMAVREFAMCESRQMFFVCLVEDPSRDNPVGTLTGRERREQAARIAGYLFEKDGKRLDKNGRMAVAGQAPTIERAIEKFRELHYNDRHVSREATKKQIQEIQAFLASDKRVLKVNKEGEPVLDIDGKQIWETDLKALAFALDHGPKLVELHDTLDKLEAELRRGDDTNFEGESFSAADLEPNEDMPDDLPAIERYIQNVQNKG
jgi:hypothetical protein